MKTNEGNRTPKWLDREEGLFAALLLLLLLLLCERVMGMARFLCHDPTGLRVAVPIFAAFLLSNHHNAVIITDAKTYRICPMFPNVSWPSSRFANRFAR